MKIVSIPKIKFYFRTPNNKSENNSVVSNNKIFSCFSYPKNYYINQISFGTNKEIYEQMANARSNEELMSLFNKLPDNTKAKYYHVVEHFDADGLTLDNYIPACIKKPSLFYQSPETIEKNVKGLVKKFETNGLTLDNYIPACLKQPSLFYQSPETIEKNVKGLVKKFEANGLTLDNYISVCLKQPTLFYQTSETIEKNVKDLVKKFEGNGLTLDNYILTCIKQPPLFYQSPETIAEHIDILRLSYFNNGDYIDNEQFFNRILKNYIELSCSSKLLLIKHLIIPKIFENNKIPKSLRLAHLENNLEEYLKKELEENPDLSYLINVKNIETDSNWQNALNKYLDKLHKNLGKEVIKVNVEE